jgi:hypothetical protein
MKLAILALALIYAAHAHTQTIKGHTLGETMQEFSAEATDLTKANILKCAAAPADNGSCDVFLKVVQAGGNGSFPCDEPIFQTNTVCKEFRGRVTFKDNKLVELNLEVMNKPWESVLEDMTAKFGKPADTRTRTEQNVYGAKWELQSATWTSETYLATAFEKINTPYNLNRFVAITVSNRAYWERLHPVDSKSSIE